MKPLFGAIQEALVSESTQDFKGHLQCPPFLGTKFCGIIAVESILVSDSPNCFEYGT